MTPRQERSFARLLRGRQLARARVLDPRRPPGPDFTRKELVAMLDAVGAPRPSTRVRKPELVERALAAWTTWRSGLVDILVAQASAALAGKTPQRTIAPPETGFACGWDIESSHVVQAWTTATEHGLGDRPITVARGANVRSGPRPLFATVVEAREALCHDMVLTLMAKLPRLSPPSGR